MIKYRILNIPRNICLLEKDPKKGMLNNGSQSTAASGGASTSIELFSQDNDMDSTNICLNFVEESFIDTLNTIP
jgi:hypothetical protein